MKNQYIFFHTLGHWVTNIFSETTFARALPPTSTFFECPVTKLVGTGTTCTVAVVSCYTMKTQRRAALESGTVMHMYKNSEIYSLHIHAYLPTNINKNDINMMLLVLLSDLLFWHFHEYMSHVYPSVQIWQNWHNSTPQPALFGRHKCTVWLVKQCHRPNRYNPNHCKQV